MANRSALDPRSIAQRNVYDALRHLARLTPSATRAPHDAKTPAGSCFRRVTQILAGKPDQRV
jgi:hypothetical protein